MPKSTLPTEADIIFNRAALRYARSQQLLQSILGPAPPDSAAGRKTEAELEKEEAEIFKVEPELFVCLTCLPTRC